MKKTKKVKKAVDKTTGKRYSSVIEMVEDMGMSKAFVRRLKKMIEDDKKNLTTVEEDGIVYLVDKRTGKKL